MKIINQDWKIIEKGNTIKQLSIHSENDEKICGNISPKNLEIANLLKNANRMLVLLRKYKNDAEVEELLNEIDKF